MTELRGVTLAIWDHTMLLAARHKREFASVSTHAVLLHRNILKVIKGHMQLLVHKQVLISRK